MGLKLAAASGGSIELAPTNTASDFTVTVPAATGTVLLNNSSDQIINGLTVGEGGGSVSTNTAVGYQAQNATATLGSTTAVGYQAAYSNTGAEGLTYIGRWAGYSTTTGSNNTSVGVNSLFSNTTGANNVANGHSALFSNTTASNNTAVGYQAGYSNSTGTYNTYIGIVAGYSATGSNNTFIGCSSAGYGAGYFVTTGAKNTIIGGYNGNQGGLDIRTASNYIVLSDGDGTPRLWYNGATNYVYAPAVYSQSAALSANVGVDSQGALFRATSSLKYKTEVSNATHGLADVLKLRSVTYKGKNKTVDKQTVFGGLIAEEVHEAGLTEFVQYADDGTPDALAYGNMVALAFKAIQELKALVDTQASTITSLTDRITALENK